MYTEIAKELALNGGQIIKFRKTEGRSGEVKEIHDLIRELECQRKKRTTPRMMNMNEADTKRVALLLCVTMSECGKVLAGQGDTLQTYDIKGTSAQQYLLSHSNSVSDYMFQPTKRSSSGLSS